MGEANLFQSDFISAKFCYCNERVSFAAVEDNNRAIDIRGTLESYDLSKHG